MQSMAQLKFVFGIAAIGLAGGCVLGPDYRAPELGGWSSFRHGQGGQSFADRSWESVFEDSAMRKLIWEALENNPDLVAATYRIEESRAIAGIAQSEFFPFIAANVQGGRERSSAIQNERRSAPDALQNNFRLGGLLSYEVDLWGRIKRSNEAARAALLSSIYQQVLVRNTLIASVASAYIDLIAADARLRIANDTLMIRRDALKLMRERADGGAISELEYQQAMVLVNEAELAVPRIQIDIARNENRICVLLGCPPKRIPRGQQISRLQSRTKIRAGIPAELLVRRPDILSAEQALIARNADIGAARALMFPTLSLTGAAGFRSADLDRLVSAPNRNLAIGVDVFTPIFAGGRFQMLTAAATARREQAVADYQKTIQLAFQESADALMTHQQAMEILDAQSRLVESLKEVTRLARLRFDEGATDYLQVLDADRNLFASQIAEVDAQQLCMLSMIEAFRALGGGWK